MCKYNSHFYWEYLLRQQKEPWQDVFAELESGQDAIFINTAIIDYAGQYLDNHWACYPDTQSLLGFLQYIHLPLIFSQIIRDDADPPYIMICSTADFTRYIHQSGCDYTLVMIGFLQELQSLWNLNSNVRIDKIKEFCTRFNAFWNNERYILNIQVFFNTFEIARFLRDANEFIEVLEEEMGFTFSQFLQLCHSFYHNRFIQKSFVKILNHKIGCII